MKTSFCTLLLCSAFFVNAQKIKGTVIDQKTLLPISGALVQLANDSISAVTDENGQFEFTKLGSGLYNVVVSHLGYITAIQKEVWTRPRAVTTISFNLEQSAISLDEVQVKGSKGWEPLSSRSITEEQINRFAATYYDPARLVAASPDVAVTNDQNNRISVRGISPDYNTWRLEGAEILNPNHLSNAGTFNDQPAGTGGGVNILSAQMLDRSSFMYGNMGSSIGNSVGGVFDMNLRAGQSESRRHVAQASFIGFDLGTEGAFKENGKATYLLNYRYSFTGLLTNLGVDFGGESIGFQDLSFVAHIPTANQGAFKVFASGGTSFNRFAHRPFAESEREKDRSDIDYEGRMGLTGISFSNGRLQASVVASGFQNERTQVNYDASDTPETTLTSRLDQSLISTNFSTYHQSGRHRIKTGMMANFYQLTEGAINLFRFYQENSFRISSKLELDYGFAVIAGNFKERAVDGRTALRYFINPQHELSISYGSYHQLLTETNRLFEAPIPPSDPLPENEQSLIQSKRAILAYTRYFTNARLGIEVFDYFFPEVQYLSYPFFSSSESVQFGKAHSTGLSVKLDRDFYNGWYFNMGTSLFNAGYGYKPEWKGWRFNSINTLYNTRYNLVLSTGKTFILSDKNGKRNLNANVRWMQQGPTQRNPYYDYADWWISRHDTNEYVIESTDEIELSIAPPPVTNHYMRLDLRIQYLKQGKVNTSWALDIQNVLNRQNQAFYYFDGFINQQQISYHLGLIPILTYRVEF